MTKSLWISTCLAALIAGAAPASAQRANENAVESADDAFGTSVGNEKIGLYSAGDVRGFSPSSAGNIRVEGLAITDHGGFNPRIASGSTIRVGLTAQGYPFLAPTGIADYALRNSGNDAVVSPVFYFGPNATLGLDIDAQLPIVGDRLSLAAGLSYRYEENFPGEDGQIAMGGGVLRWRPSDRVEIKSFYSRQAFMDDRDNPNIFVAGPWLPPEIERRYYGLDWTETETRREIYGALGAFQIADDWQIRAGLFRAENRIVFNPVELLRNVRQDGSGERVVVTTADQYGASTSGEVRTSHSIVEGNRQHTLHMAVRGRDTLRRIGGADVFIIGPAFVGEEIDAPEPDFAFGELTRDEIRQVTGGIGYELRWPGTAELSLALQKTDYEKNSFRPGQPVLTTLADPWLYNGALAIHLTERLVAYAGYARGLEESGSPPANALNRNFAPPALMTSQRDAGIRFRLMPRLSFVAGVFDVRKPYFNLDPGLVYRQLGTVRHRGIELSMAGQPVDGLNVVAGAVFLDADVSGEAVDLGIIGPKPVGTTRRTIRANFDYRLPFFDPVSIDLGINHQAGRIASPRGYSELGGRQFMTDPRTTFDVGARYRFNVGSTPATLRAQVTNLFDTFGWNVGSNAAFGFNEARRFLLTLAADL